MSSEPSSPSQAATPPTPTNGAPPPPGAPAPPFIPPPNSLDSLRFQHLYTLALADRMRLLNPLWPAPRPLPGPPQHPAGPSATNAGGPLSDNSGFYKGLDPRYFGRGPEEPKPQQSYIGLIALAILSSPDEKLVLADIYQYILDNFPYFRHRGPGWRNSIRHNLSLNDCFIKAGRAANGKGHYWAIHTACIEDFKKGDFRRRKAQRKVRRHMGLAVDEEDSPSPPPPPPQGFFGPPGWPPMPMRLPPPALPTSMTQFALPPLNPLPLPPPPSVPSVVPTQPQQATSTAIRVKRQFDMASLLASESSKKDAEDIVEVSNNNNDETEANEDSTSWRSVSPPSTSSSAVNATQGPQVSTPVLPPQPLMAHQYLARYYQLVQHQNQQNSAAAAAAAAALAAAAAASVNNHSKSSEVTSSPRGSPNSPILHDRSY